MQEVLAFQGSTLCKMGILKNFSHLLPSALRSQHSKALSKHTFQAVTYNEETENAYRPTHFHTEYVHLSPLSLLSSVPNCTLLEIIFSRQSTK